MYRQTDTDHERLGIEKNRIKDGPFWGCNWASQKVLGGYICNLTRRLLTSSWVPFYFCWRFFRGITVQFFFFLVWTKSKSKQPLFTFRLFVSFFFFYCFRGKRSPKKSNKSLSTNTRKVKGNWALWWRGSGSGSGSGGGISTKIRWAWIESQPNGPRLMPFDAMGSRSYP